MILFAESTFPSNVTIQTPTREIFSISPDYTRPNVIIRDTTISYFSPLPNVGVIIQDQPLLVYGISTL